MELNVNATQVNANVSALNLASATEKVAEMSGSQATTPLLGGAGVTVSVSGSRLDKLVAQMQLEEEDKRLKLARDRLAAALDLIDAMNAQREIEHTEAYNKIDQYARELARIEAQIATKDSDISRQDTTIQQAQREVSSAQRNYDRAQREVATAQRAVDNAQAALDGLTQAPGESDADFAARQAQAEANLAQAQQALANTQASAGQASAALSAAQANLDAATASKAQLEGEKGDLQRRQSELADLIDAQWGSLNSDEVRALLEAMKLSAADVQSIIDKEPLEKDEEQEAMLAQRAAPAKTIFKALEDYEMRLQESIEAKRETMI